MRLATFNCRSVKSSVYEILELCASSDITFLQEHWLLPNELHELGEMHSDFEAVGQSAVDLTRDICIGRPYGGTAIMYRKSFQSHVTVVETHESRITAIMFQSNIGPVLLMSVYMPTDYGDAESAESYADVCAKIAALYADCDVVHAIITGDFNCNINTRFYQQLACLVKSNGFTLSDMSHLSQHDTFTFCNDAGNATSWIDHCLCSSMIDMRISKTEVLHNFVTSDHKPLAFECCNLSCANTCTLTADSVTECVEYVTDWSAVDNVLQLNYQNELEHQLSKVNIPVHPRSCAVGVHTPSDIVTDLECYYDQIIACIVCAARLTLPHRKVGPTITVSILFLDGMIL